MGKEAASKCTVAITSATADSLSVVHHLCWDKSSTQLKLLMLLYAYEAGCILFTALL